LEALLSIALVLIEAPEAVRGLVASTGARSTEASWSIGVDWTGFLIGGGGTLTIEWQSGHRICLPTCNAWTDKIDLQTWQVIEYSRSAGGLLAGGLFAGGLPAGGKADAEVPCASRGPRAEAGFEGVAGGRVGLAFGAGAEAGKGTRSGRSSSKTLRGVSFGSTGLGLGGSFLGDSFFGSIGSRENHSSSSLGVVLIGDL